MIKLIFAWLVTAIFIFLVILTPSFLIFSLWLHAPAWFVAGFVILSWFMNNLYKDLNDNIKILYRLLA